MIEWLRTSFAGRVAWFWLLAAAAYVFVLLVVYPRFFTPFVPFHSDEYQGVDFVSLGMRGIDFFTWPRPVSFLFFFIAGHFGLAGSIACYAALTLADLALALAILERYVLRRRIAWWIAAIALIFAISGPGFYFSVGYDLEFSLAAFFGLLGIFAWESRDPAKPAPAFAGCAACFVLSTLSKESFVPILILYGIAAAFFRGRLPRGYRVALLFLPFVAAGIAFADDRLVSSPFVRIGARSADEYAIGLSPSSLAATIGFYLQPVFNAAFVAFLILCAVMAWIKGRLTIAAAVTLAAFSSCAPYLLLPNHLDACYWWAPMPFLALLIPIALVPSDRRTVWFSWGSVATVAAAAGSIALFGAYSANSDQAAFYLDQQRINARVLESIRSAAPSIARAHRVLVTGITFPFHPWNHAAYASALTGYRGTWTVAAGGEYPPIPQQPSAKPIRYDAIHWNDYDLILVFDDTGTLVEAYTPAQIERAIAERRLSGRSNLAIVGALRNAPEAATGSVFDLVYPPGVRPFGDEADAVAHGIYPDTSQDSCCFLGPKAQFSLDNPARAKRAIFTLYVPSFAPFLSRNETVAIAFDGVPAGKADVPIGLHDVTFGLPVAAQPGVEVTMTMRIVFVPKAIGVSDDTRTLTVVLKRVAYR